MSFTRAPQRTPRLNRSQLVVPGSQRELFAKAAATAADVVVLDLEDAVTPEQKPAARDNVVWALHDIDWGAKAVSVRINGLDTPYMYRDVIEVAEQAGARLDLIMIPKVGTAADVHAVDVLVTQIEQAKGFEKRIGFELLIESALGMANVNEIAAASPRNESLHFGVADFAASMKARTTDIGGFNPDYAVLGDRDAEGGRAVHYADPWHYAMARVAVAARANGLRPIDGPFGDYSDEEGYHAAARRAAVLGCEGKWAIHPRQVPLANEVFSPTPDEVAKARRILEAMEQAKVQGKGAASLDGRMIDIASVRQAEALIDRAEASAAR